MSYSMNSLKASRYKKTLTLIHTHQSSKWKIPFALDCFWLHPLPTTSKPPQSINHSQLKTNSLTAVKTKLPHPNTHPRRSWVNPGSPREFRQPDSGGSSVAAFSLSSNLQSLQKAMETSAMCIASTVGDTQNLTEVVSTFLLTKLCMIYGLQVPAKVMTNETTRNPDVSFLWGCPWAASQ